MIKKSQSALEFIILIGAMLFFFIALSLTFQQNIAEKGKQQRNLEVQELALAVQNEIDLATGSSDGYERNFNIPDKLLNIGYQITLTEGFVYIITDDDKHALALPIKNITGEILKGNNLIKKINGQVFLNEPIS